MSAETQALRAAQTAAFNETPAAAVDVAPADLVTVTEPEPVALVIEPVTPPPAAEPEVTPRRTRKASK